MMRTDKELRGSRAEIRSDGNKLIGYAAVYDSASNPLPFIETIKPGAFTKSLERRDDVSALREHDPKMILGRTGSGQRSGTLELHDDPKGLMAEITPPDTQDGREAMELVRRGDIRHMSVAFYVDKESWAIRNMRSHRDILEATLEDVSIVLYPAYQATKVATRNMPPGLDPRWGRTRGLLLDLKRSW